MPFTQQLGALHGRIKQAPSRMMKQGLMDGFGYKDQFPYSDMGESGSRFLEERTGIPSKMGQMKFEADRRIGRPSVAGMGIAPKSQLNEMGEIIDPTPEQVKRFNELYETVIPKEGRARGKFNKDFIRQPLGERGLLPNVPRGYQGSEPPLHTQDRYDFEKMIEEGLAEDERRAAYKDPNFRAKENAYNEMAEYRDPSGDIYPPLKRFMDAGGFLEQFKEMERSLGGRAMSRWRKENYSNVAPFMPSPPQKNFSIDDLKSIFTRKR